MGVSFCRIDSGVRVDDHLSWSRTEKRDPDFLLFAFEAAVAVAVVIGCPDYRRYEVARILCKFNATD